MMAKTLEEKKAARAAHRAARKKPVEHTPEFLASYLKAYGQWAGNQAGHKPDYSRCCVEVSNRGTMRFHQCSRPNGHGPDGAHCSIHDPARVEARCAEADRKYKEKWAGEKVKMALGYAGQSLVQALIDIEKGHNDARGRATEALAALREKGVI